MGKFLEVFMRDLLEVQKQTESAPVEKKEIIKSPPAIDIKEVN